MRDDLEFNIHLVQRVESYPCLYDHTREDYTRRYVQEKAWKEIAAKMGETMSDCKARWKNLRGRYIKVKNQYIPSGSGAVKNTSYYLSEFMQFLDQLSVSRPSKGNIQKNLSEDANLQDYDDEMNSMQKLEREEKQDVPDICSKEVSSENAQPEAEPGFSFNEETNQSQTALSVQDKIHTQGKSMLPAKTCYRKRDRRQQSTQASLEEVNRSALEYFNMKKQAKESSSNMMALGDPDAAFLFSVLPDMKKMRDDVKRRFKVKLLQLVEETLDCPSSNRSPSCTSFASSTEH